MKTTWEIVEMERSGWTWVCDGETLVGCSVFGDEMIGRWAWRGAGKEWMGWGKFGPREGDSDWWVDLFWKGKMVSSNKTSLEMYSRPVRMLRHFAAFMLKTIINKHTLSRPRLKFLRIIWTQIWPTCTLKNSKKRVIRRFF
jgi:hypothetical protein